MKEQSSCCDDFIKKLQATLPEVCRVKDLIRIGIFTTDQSAAYARRNNMGPEFFRVNAHKVIYPKDGVIKFLQKTKSSSARAV